MPESRRARGSRTRRCGSAQHRSRPGCWSRQRGCAIFNASCAARRQSCWLWCRPPQRPGPLG
eukprot:11186009-Lingulodinium_polyedra.AAC.1